MTDLSAVLTDGFLDVQPDGLMRFSLWYENAGISRSMAYDLQKILQISPQMRRVQGSKRPAAFLNQEQQHLMNSCVQLIKNGHSLPEIKERVADHLANSQTTDSKQSEALPENESEETGIVPAPKGEMTQPDDLKPSAEESEEPSDLVIPLQGDFTQIALEAIQAWKQTLPSAPPELDPWDELDEFARKGKWVSQKRMAKALGLKDIDESWNGTKPFPDFQLDRVEHSSGRINSKNKKLIQPTVLWKVRDLRTQENAPREFTGLTGGLFDDGPEQNAAQMTWDITADDCTGSSLMAQNRIS